MRATRNVSISKTCSGSPLDRIRNGLPTAGTYLVSEVPGCLVESPVRQRGLVMHGYSAHSGWIGRQLTSTWQFMCRGIAITIDYVVTIPFVTDCQFLHPLAFRAALRLRDCESF